MKSGRPNILFVCSRNAWRSPTAERIYRRDPRFAVRSAGMSQAAKRTVTGRDLLWADIIMAMESEHADRLRPLMRKAGSRARLVTLDIPDDYAFMDPELVDTIRNRVEEIVAD